MLINLWSDGLSSQCAVGVEMLCCALTGRASRTEHLPKVSRSSFVRRLADTVDPSVVMSSHMCIYGGDSDLVRALSMDWFIKSAVGYRLTGEPTRCLCEHNAAVASGLSRSQIAQTWRLVRLMCAVATPQSNTTHVQPALPIAEPGLLTLLPHRSLLIALLLLFIFTAVAAYWCQKTFFCVKDFLLF